MKRIALKFYGYVKKDIVLLVKRKKYLYLSLLLPLIITGIFLFMLNPNGKAIKVGVCDYDSTSYSKQAFSGLGGFDAVVLPKEDCSANLTSMVKSGKYSLGLEVPKGFSDRLEDLKQARLVVYYDNTDIAFSNLVSWKVDVSLLPYERAIIDALNEELKKKISVIRFNVDLVKEITQSGQIADKIGNIDTQLMKIEELETEFILNPIYAHKQGVYEQRSTEGAGIAFIFPILAMFVLLMLSSTSLIYDKKTNFIVRVKVSTSPLVYLFAKLFFFFLLTIVQFLIVLLLFLVNGSTYSMPLVNVLNVILFISIINTLIGIVIGSISENEGIALLFSLIISFPLMLLSGIFFPIQTMPGFVQYLAKILPLNYQINAMKSVFLLGAAIGWQWLIPALFLVVLVYVMIKRM